MSLLPIDLWRAYRRLFWAPERMQAHQAQLVRDRITHAFEQVPYYRKVMDEAGLLPSDITGAADLCKLPVTTKGDLRGAGIQARTARDHDPERLFGVFSSGSNGEPFEILLSPEDVRRRRIVDMRMLMCAGLRPGRRFMSIGPVLQGAPPGRRPRLMPLERVSLDLPPDQQISRLRAVRPHVLWIFPSLLRAILERLGGELERVCRPRVLITSAEVCDPELRKNVFERLDIERFDFYGCVESGRVAFEGPDHSGLYVPSDHIVLEVLPVAGARTGDAVPLGETVITTLNNHAMPFIRYRVGDLVPLELRTEGGRYRLPRIGEVEGRRNQLIRLKGNRSLSPLVLMLAMRRTSKVRTYRITQTDLDAFTVELVPNEGLGPEELAKIEALLRAPLRDEVTIRLEVVDALSQRGFKRTEFVSQIDV